MVPLRDDIELGRMVGASDEVLRRALGTLRDVLVVVDADMKVSYVSPSLREVVGFEPEEALGWDITRFVHPEEHEIARAHIAERFREQDGGTLTHRTLHKDGRVRYFESMIHVLEADGEFLGVVFNARDVTDRINERRDLEQEVAFNRALVATTNELLRGRLDEGFYQKALERALELVPDAQGGSMQLRDDDDDASYGFVAAVGFDMKTLRDIRMRLEELGRATPPQVQRMSSFDIIEPLSPELMEAFEREGRLHEIKMTLSVPIVVNGVLRGYLNLDNFEHHDAFDDRAQAIAEALAAQVGVALQRLTLEHDLNQERARYELLASHDALTGLPNRRLFQDRLDLALSRAQRRDKRVALLFIDLDGFKAVNDSYGHDIGDELLSALATRLQETVRGEDTVARFGGDEFIVLLSEIADVGDAVAVAEKVLLRLRAPFDLRGQDVRVGASVGVAVFPDHAADSGGLMKSADTAMYRVKATGAGGVASAAD